MGADAVKYARYPPFQLTPSVARVLLELSTPFLWPFLPTVIETSSWITAKPCKRRSGSIMKVPLLTRYLPLFAVPALAQDFLVGYGNWNYDPICAQSCIQAFRPYLLNCSDLEAAKKPFDPIAPPTTAVCYSKDEAFLTTAAWCLKSKCPDESIAKLEGYWQQSVTGTKLVPPKWSYTIALDKVDPKPPTYQLTFNDTKLNRTSLVVENSYLASWNGMTSLYHEEVTESTFRYLSSDPFPSRLSNH